MKCDTTSLESCFDLKEFCGSHINISFDAADGIGVFVYVELNGECVPEGYYIVRVTPNKFVILSENEFNLITSK